MALGLFRSHSELLWPRLCLLQDRIYSRYTEVYCILADPLIKEFYQNPLSLQQLSRIEIRRAIGINDFEAKAKALPLPPPLLSYVWLANEMLAQISLAF